MSLISHDFSQGSPDSTTIALISVDPNAVFLEAGGEIKTLTITNKSNILNADYVRVLNPPKEITVKYEGCNNIAPGNKCIRLGAKTRCKQ